MKGFVRQVDGLGRISIPAELRQSLGLGRSDDLRITCVPGGILLTPLTARCGICGSTDGLLVVDGIAICRKHAVALRQMLEGEKGGRLDDMEAL